jgi:hypothetical protein
MLIYIKHFNAQYPYHIFLEIYLSLSSSSSPLSSYIRHAVGPFVDPFRPHVSRSLFKVLPWFLLPVGQHCFITLGNLLRGILFTCCIQFLSGFFLWDLPVVKISPECVTRPPKPLNVLRQFFTIDQSAFLLCSSLRWRNYKQSTITFQSSCIAAPV